MKTYHENTLKSFKAQLKETVQCKKLMLLHEPEQKNSFKLKKLEITEEWLKLKIHLMEFLIKKEKSVRHQHKMQH